MLVKGKIRKEQDWAPQWQKKQKKWGGGVFSGRKVKFKKVPRNIHGKKQIIVQNILQKHSKSKKLSERIYVYVQSLRQKF